MNTIYTKAGPWFVVFALIGAGLGYYVGHSRGVEEGIVQERAASAAVSATAGARAAATNPLQDVKTNPYKNLRTNPFQ